MKKFGRILICLILCVFTIGLCACGDKKVDPFFQTKAESYVTGNGGLAVESDGYLYFVNGFLSCKEQSKKDASYTVGSLKVAKLVDGRIVFDEDGYLEDEYLRTMNTRLCGFEATGLYVFGNYLYFTAPCQENVKGEGWAKERVNFYRIKLNKSGNAERIYQSKVNFDSLSYEYYFNGINVYLMVCEKGDNSTSMYRIDATGSKHNKVTVSDSVENFYLGAKNDYIVENYNQGCVFFVEKTEDNTYNYVLYNPTTGNKKSVENSRTATVQYADDRFVYYTTAVDDKNNALVRCSIYENDTFGGAETVYDYTGDVKFVINGADAYVVSDKTISVVKNRSYAETLLEEENTITILGFANGGIIYYNGNNKIKKVNCTSALVEDLSDVANIKTDYYSVGGNYAYYYATVNDSHNYLFRTSIYDGGCQLIGVYDEADKPKVEEEEEY